MQVDIEVESKLDCVLIVVAGANQLIESPAPHRIRLGHFECLELSRSHPFPLEPQCRDYSPCGPDRPRGKSLVRVKVQRPRTPALRTAAFAINVLGLHALVKGGAELMQGYALAIRLGATIDDIADGIYAFPTMGEAVHYAAEMALAPAAVA